MFRARVSRELVHELAPGGRDNVLGRYPTSVQHLKRLSTASCDLWVKRDDLTNEVYGGNKVRKLEGILRAAGQRQARRIVTLGAAGSHHVLATTIHGARAGFRVAALLVTQPRGERAEWNLRAALGQGLEAHPVPHLAALGWALAHTLKAGDYFVPPGGSNVIGSAGYFDAAGELMRQVEQQALPMPEVIVVPLGSGGTAAGLLAGLVSSGFRGTLLAVRIVSPWLMGPVRTLALARAVLDKAGVSARLGDLRRHLKVDGSYLGKGYGFPCEAGDRATTLASQEGLVIEPTYTAKAFAAALDRVTVGEHRHVLYWHTFSSAPLQPLLVGAPSFSELPAGLRSLLTIVRKPSA